MKYLLAQAFGVDPLTSTRKNEIMTVPTNYESFSG
uniref:Uncharacterized protein n=1 Tax=Rhizophora mucronata TaxID=61149 RepID=A0A2P2PZ41_RHIMU